MPKLPTSVAEPEPVLYGRSRRRRTGSAIDEKLDFKNVPQKFTEVLVSTVSTGTVGKV